MKAFQGPIGAKESHAPYHETGVKTDKGEGPFKKWYVARANLSHIAEKVRGLTNQETCRFPQKNAKSGRAVGPFKELYAATRDQLHSIKEVQRVV